MTDKDELLRQARAIKSEAEIAVRRTEERHQVYLQNLARHLYSRIRSSRSEAEKCLAHAEKNVRIAALESLQDIWQANDLRFQTDCERMITQDSNEEVKIVALNCLAKCHEGTNNDRVTKWLAGLVKDELLSIDMRIAAYFGLLIVTGDFQRHPELVVEFEFPKSVDWLIVNRL